VQSSISSNCAEGRAIAVEYNTRKWRAPVAVRQGTSKQWVPDSGWWVPVIGQLSKAILGVGAFTILIAGCAVGPQYHRPEVPGQAHWSWETSSTNAMVLPEAWWKVFEDDALNATMELAVSANQNLKVAQFRVTEARALARLNAAERFPTVSANAAYSHSHLSGNRPNVPGQSLDVDDHSATFDMSYELDVWGRVQRTVEAAKADAAAVESDLAVVLLTLTSDVARNYFLLRSLDNELDVVRATLVLREDAVSLQSTRYQAGLINEVDVTRARTELANVEAERHALDRDRAQIEHALAVLCGQPAGEFHVDAVHWNGNIPEVPAGMPSTLIERRPDLVEAEQSLAAACARVGVAKAAFFPTIKLTGGAGVASADLASIVDWPSRVAAFGPSVSVPVFTGGRNRANLKAAQARYDQSVAQYRGAILRAFREVEDALSNLTTLASEAKAVSRALYSARDTAALAAERYERGLSNYLEVVDAQRLALQAERQETQLRGERAVSTILLAKAIGGGWQPTPSE